MIWLIYLMIVLKLHKTMLMKYGAPVYCLAVQTKQLSWSTKCTTGVLVKHGTPVYCLAVQVKQHSWGAKRTTGVP